MPSIIPSVESSRLVSNPLVVLPIEIVAKVFECCLPDGPTRLKAPLQTLCPLTLTWVCKQWRELSLSLPTLWSDISLGHRGSDPEKDAQVLELWQSRSGQFQISLKLNYEVDDALHPVLFDREKHAAFSRGIRILLDTTLISISRWRTFEIHTLDIDDLERIFFALVMQGAPHLRNISFSTKYLGFFGDIYKLDFSKCPSLRTVCLRSPTISPILAPQSTTMQNMTSLNLSFCSSVIDCFHWMDICPVLEQLVARIFCSDSEPEPPRIKTEHFFKKKVRCFPQLTNLEVHCFSNDSDVGPLLSVLDAPSLKRLCINMYDMISSSTRWSYALDLIRRSAPPLEKFEIQGTPMKLEDIIECLRLLPTLKRLAVGTVEFSNPLVEALSITKKINKEEPNTNERYLSSNPLCPSLQSLDLVNAPWSLDLLASMVSSRCPNSSSNQERLESVSFLDELHLDIESASIARSHPILAHCMTQGLVITGSECNLLQVGLEDQQVYFV